MVRHAPLSAVVGIAILCASLQSHDGVALAAQEAISDDGRDVLLQDNGTWEFHSNDRYANLPDGRRVRLKEDGTWEYIGNAPLTTKTQTRTTTTDISLQGAVIEIHQEQNYKNVRTETQTEFSLLVALSPLAEEGVTIDGSSLALIKVTDNQGAYYPVLSLAPAGFTLAPNTQQVFTLRVAGSPSWLKGIRSMQLELAPGVFGNRETVTMTLYANEMDRKTVKGFPTL